MMNDSISRAEVVGHFQRLKEASETSGQYNEGFVDGLDYCISFISTLPSAEPVQHEECEYIITKGKAGYHEEYKCSACGDSFYWTQDRYIPRRFNYCRNCGRKVIRFIEKDKEGMTNNE